MDFLASLKPWQLVALAVLFFLTTLTAGYFGRDVTAKKQIRELQSKYDTSQAWGQTSTAQVTYTENQLHQVTAQLTELKKKAKTWDKGSRHVLADGSVVEDWDKGTENSEDSLTQLTTELEEMSKELEQSETKAAQAMGTVSRLETEKLSLQEDVKRAGFRGAVLVGYELGLGLPLERARLQGLGAIGPVLVGVSLAPGGPWASPGNMDGFDAILGSLRPAGWVGLKL